MTIWILKIWDKIEQKYLSSTLDFRVGGGYEHHASI